MDQYKHAEIGAPMAEKQTHREVLDRHYAARGGARLTVQQHRPRRDGTGWTLAIVAALALVVGILIGATARAETARICDAERCVVLRDGVRCWVTADVVQCEANDRRQHD